MHVVHTHIVHERAMYGHAVHDPTMDTCATYGQVGIDMLCSMSTTGVSSSSTFKLCIDVPLINVCLHVSRIGMLCMDMLCRTGLCIDMLCLDRLHAGMLCISLLCID